jgi:copper chaperone NosL
MIGKHITKGAVTLTLAVLVSCTTGPEPIHYGKDACDHCRMTIMDPKFGAELVTTKGKVFKYDDVNCMVNHAKGLPDGMAGATHLLIADMAAPATLIPVQSAFFLRSDEIRSPMGSRVAAFSDAEVRDSLMAVIGGTVIDWHGLKALYE